MTLSDLSAIGSFVSGIAVLVSLVFLYFQLRQLNAQIRQGEVNQQALVKQARTNRVMEINARMTDRSFAEVNLRISQNAPNLTLVDVMRYSAHARTVFQNGEESFSQHLRGLTTESDFVSFASAMRWGFQTPALRVAWRRHRAMFDEPYTGFVDTLVSEAVATPMPRDLLEQWRTELARETGGSAPPARKARPSRRPASTGSPAGPRR